MKRKDDKNWVAWLMRNYRLTFLLVGLLLLLGLYGLERMPKAEFPDFTIRQGVVAGLYPGATSEEVEEQLARPLERYLFTFKEVNRAKTTSMSQNGVCMVMVELQDDVSNKDEVWSKIKHGLLAFKSTLPSGVADVVANDEFGDTSALLIAVESETRSYRELSDYCDLLGDELRRIPSVSNVRIYGDVKEQLTLYVDRDRMSAYGIDADVLNKVLHAQGTTTVSGRMTGWEADVPIHVKTTVTGEEEIGNQIVWSDNMGRTVRVRDIARIEREYDESVGFIEYNGHRCVILSMEMQEGNNIVQYGRDVDRVLDSFRADVLPTDVTINRISDQAKVVGESVSSFLRDLFLSMLVIIVVMMVLFPWRSALVAAVTIPLSTFISLGIMYLCQIPLNTITLAALIVVLGMIVDNSIVVIDGYLEYLNRGLSRWHAAARSAQQYFMPMALATLCISVTFFPLLFTVNGQKGDFLHDFPWTIAINLMVSLLVAMVVIPILEVWLIRRQPQKKGTPSITDRVQTSYNRLLGWMFRHGWLTLAIGAAVLLSLVLYAPQVRVRMMPVSDRDQFAVEIYLPQGTGLAETKAVADSVRSLMMRDERVLAITSFIGCSSPRFQSSYAPQPGGKNYAQFIVNTTSNEATEGLLDDLTPKWAEAFPQAFVKFKQLDAQMFDALEFRFYGEDLDSLHYAADQLMAYMRTRPDLLWVHSNYEQPEPIVEVTLDPVTASQLGISRSATSLQLMSQTSGITATTVWEGNYGLPVVIKDERQQKADFSHLRDMYVKPAASPLPVPLRQVADVSPSWSERKIVHRNGVRCITVTANTQRGVIVGEIEPEIERVMKHDIHLPQGIRTEIGGEVENDEESMPQLGAGLLIAAVIIFFFLLFNFRKYGLTIVSMVAILLFLPGAMFGLWLTGTMMGMTTIFGFITLMGMIMRNEILIFEHAEGLRREGHTARDAAYHAGQRRMVPIFLTTATTAVGVLPMIISGSSMWKSVGITIFAGGIGALLLVVTMLPVVYWKLYDKKKK